LENNVLLLLILILTGLALTVLLWIGTRWFQGYIYSEPEPELYWRAPAAAGAVTLLLALWCLLESRWPKSFDTLFNFSPRQTKSFAEIWTVRQGEKTRYTLGKDADGKEVYLDDQRKQPRSRPDEVIVKEDNREVTFKAERDRQGNFKVERGQPLRYRDDRGRALAEGEWRLSTFRWRLFFLNWLLNMFHFGLWFAALWLLLRFQWSHALGLAVIIWLSVTLFVVPVLLAQVPQPRTTPAAAAAELASGAGTSCGLGYTGGSLLIEEAPQVPKTRRRNPNREWFWRDTLAAWRDSGKSIHRSISG
jgi:hypothetical protein